MPRPGATAGRTCRVAYPSTAAALREAAGFRVAQTVDLPDDLRAPEFALGSAAGGLEGGRQAVQLGLGCHMRRGGVPGAGMREAHLGRAGTRVAVVFPQQGRLQLVNLTLKRGDMAAECRKFLQLNIRLQARHLFQPRQIDAMIYHPARAFRRMVSAKRMAAATAANCSVGISSPSLTVA